MKLEITRQWLTDALARGGPDDLLIGTTASTAPGPAPTAESIMRAMDEILPRLKAGTERLGAASVAAAASMGTFSNVLRDYERREYSPRFDVLYGLSPVRDSFLGVRVLSSPAAVTIEPRRRHRRRRGQTLAYHRRIQKKWTKRFGTEAKPCAYKLADGTLIVHPTLYDRLMKRRPT